MREEKNEIYIGGAAAIAGNVAKFCGKVTLMSMVGEDRKFQNLIKKSFQKMWVSN